MITTTVIKEKINQTSEELHYSGVILAKKQEQILLNEAFGFRNRSDQLENNLGTRFGIASGTKLFTSIAICQLVEQELISFDTKLKDCLSFDFPYFDEEITIHHLLTHTSGIPDYFDEAVMDNFEELWVEHPMYSFNQLSNFLPLFQKNQMMFKPGDRFHYNNAGFILLGLIVEQVTGTAYTKYIEENIFQKCEMNDSGFFSLDKLPANTAIGYIDFEDGTWKTNTYSIPIKGGSDGGAFITAPDLMKLWNCLLNGDLLSKTTVEKLLTPFVETDEEDEFYGYGIWISKKDNQIVKFHIMGYDPGVSFHSCFYPHLGSAVVVTCNQSFGAYDILEVVEEALNI